MKEKIVGTIVKGTVDRSMGSNHPNYTEMIYPINYGYVDGVIGGDGKEQDAYILGVDKALKVFEGRVVAIYHRINDDEDKWIVVIGDKEYTDDEIMDAI
jgi:inorganic diphosphatase